MSQDVDQAVATAAAEAAPLLLAFVRQHRNTCKLLGLPLEAAPQGAIVAMADLIAAMMADADGTPEERIETVGHLRDRIVRLMLDDDEPKRPDTSRN